MRISRVSLSWFRGASDSAHLDCGAKSIVLYGANGSGKSSFADAVEYMVTNGRVGHLAHEYSGARQEKGIRNTHTPAGTPSRVRLEFEGGESLDATVTEDGRVSVSESREGLATEVQAWDLERLVLRQDELARFISTTKGEKYSALLPLLGLSPFELAAENLRRLQESFEKVSDLDAIKQELTDLHGWVLTVLPEVSLKVAEEVLAPLVTRYIESEQTRDFEDLTEYVEAAINQRVALAEPEQRRHFALEEIEAEGLQGKLSAARLADRRAANLAAGLDQQIAVLEEAARFVEAIEGGPKAVDCPACGRAISLAALASHVNHELAELEKAREVHAEAVRARRALSSSVSRILRIAKKPELADWIDKPTQKALSSALKDLSGFEVPPASQAWDQKTYSQLNHLLTMISSEIARGVRRTPPSTKQLIEDRQVIAACRSIPRIRDLTLQVDAIALTLQTLRDAESTVEVEASRTTAAVLNAMSQDIQRLWRLLHPQEPIEAIRLYVASEGDRTVDIALSFFGVAQPSPRLTLSEGHRNSLGLCIFLAFVLQVADAERPVILDDVVSSFDREHRGMLADLIVQELSARQVVVLTHDREWYAELRLRLPKADWIFRALRPWQSPELGIQMAQSDLGFDDARALLASNAEAAGNRVRAIMDTQLAIVAEKLKLPMEFARGDHNDHRTSAEFFERIIKESKSRLRRRDGEKYVPHVEPIGVWERSYGLLGAWGNRASHTGSLTSQEAETLIDACDSAMRCFRCEACGELIWIADQGGRERVQCGCGAICWSYS